MGYRVLRFPGLGVLGFTGSGGFRIGGFRGVLGLTGLGLRGFGGF